MPARADEERFAGGQQDAEGGRPLDHSRGVDPQGQVDPDVDAVIAGRRTAAGTTEASVEGLGGG